MVAVLSPAPPVYRKVVWGESKFLPLTGPEEQGLLKDAGQLDSVFILRRDANNFVSIYEICLCPRDGLKLVQSTIGFDC